MSHPAISLTFWDNACVRLILLLLSALVLLCCCWAPPATLGHSPAATHSKPVPPSLSTRQLVDRVIAAYGGPDRLKQARDGAFRSQGSFSSTSGISGASNAFDCDLITKSNKLRIETKVMGLPMV